MGVCIGERCAIYRKYSLRMSRKEFCARTGAAYQTIAAFECGRSHNIKHLELYYAMSTDKSQWLDFCDSLFEGD